MKTERAKAPFPLFCHLCVSNSIRIIQKFRLFNFSFPFFNFHCFQLPHIKVCIYFCMLTTCVECYAFQPIDVLCVIVTKKEGERKHHI